MSFQVQSFTQGVSEGRAALVTRVNTALAGTARQIISASVQRFYSTRNNERLTIRLLYNTAGGNANTAAYVEGTTSSTLEASFTSYQTANPTKQVLFVLDLSNRTPRAVERGAVCVIATATLPRAGREAYVGEALGNITLGGTNAGTAKLYDSNGILISASAPVVNVSLLTTWLTGQRNLVVFDPITNVLIGIPSCCGVGNPLP